MIDLGVGGTSWSGFTFGKWGRARDWFLFDRHGTRYSAIEIESITAMTHDLCYLKTLVRDLQRYASPKAAHFTEAEARLLRAAAEIVTSRIRTSAREMVTATRAP